jgi:hypothetical protein
VRGDIKSIFDCSAPAQVFALLNEFLHDLARSLPLGEIPAHLLPRRIDSLAELESWLIPIRIEAERQQAQFASKNTQLINLSRMLDAANRQIRMFMPWQDQTA